MVRIVIEQVTRSVRTGFEARHLSKLFFKRIFRDYGALRPPLDIVGYAQGSRVNPGFHPGLGLDYQSEC
jgi:hypothetical protein